MNSHEETYYSNYYTYHPTAVTATLPGDVTVTGLFDKGYKSNGRNRAGMDKPVLHRFFRTYIDNQSYFLGNKGQEITIDGVTYKQVDAQLLETMYAVQVWLS